MLDWLNSFFTTSTAEVALNMTNATYTLATSVLLGFCISLTYRKTAKAGQYSSNFALTLILLPGIVSIIILFIGSNIARAFSLAGAFSIIRFRSAPGDPKDIAYVLFTMAAGLAVGVGTYGYGILFTIAFCLLMLILHVVRYGQPRAEQRLLKITIPEDLAYEEAFAEVFNKFHLKHELLKVKTTELGSLYELVYAVEINDTVKQKELLDEIRCRNGNLDITLTMKPTAGEA